jgi:hypothetical protein
MCTPPLRPLVKLPSPLPPARIWLLITTCTAGARRALEGGGGGAEGRVQALAWLLGARSARSWRRSGQRERSGRGGGGGELGCSGAHLALLVSHRLGGLGRLVHAESGQAGRHVDAEPAH